MKHAGIAGKIWISISVFALGTLLSLGVSQVASVWAEGRLRLTSDMLFPAARAGQQAQSAFEKMANEFQDAVMLEEASALEQGRRDGLAAARALKTAAERRASDVARARALEALASDVSAFVKEAAAAYAPMLTAGDRLTPEMAETSRQLAARTASLKRAVDIASEQLAADLRGELAGAVSASAAQRWLSLVVFFGALAVCGTVVTITIRKAIVAPICQAVVELAEAAGQVATSSHQFATSSQSLSQGASQQAASLEETSASIEEMAAMTRKNADNSEAVASLMTQVDAHVLMWNDSLGEVVAAMGSIQDASRQVAKITKTVDEIAFQTNILALNAAVEAARAGQAGMGFAVVADEVRSLAHRSAQAARETASLIDESIGKAEGGNLKVEQLATAIGAVIEKVTAVKRLVDEVSLASRQQTQGIDQVAEAIARMEKVTQTTAATAEESAAASEELRAQAESSMLVVRRLDALVGTGAEVGSGPGSGVKKLQIQDLTPDT